MAPGILCAARHVAPSASGSSNNGNSHSSKQKVEEKPSQFVTSNSIRPSSSMQIVNAATSCLSTLSFESITVESKTNHSVCR
jgi:hypothetical protein